MGIFKRFFLPVCLLFFGNCFAAPADSVLALSKKWFDSGKAWSFDFRVRVDYAGSPETGFQGGNLLVTGKDMFRLRIPGLAIYCDGENFWQWNKETNQVLLKLLEDMESNMHPSELLFKYLSCKPLGMKREKIDGKFANVVKLDASRYGKDFAEMEVWLSEKDASPLRLVTVDPLRNVSTYDISNLKRVESVGKSDFTLVPGKGVDVIDMR